MKRIGIIGGTTPESTIYYYRLFVDISREKFEKDFYPEIVIFNMNFKKFRALDSWEQRKEYMLSALRALEGAGAEVIGIAANTPHKVFEPLAREAKANMVSIIDALAEHAIKSGLKELLLLGTKTTMNERFYREQLEKYGIHTIIPSQREIEKIDRIINDELSAGNMESSAWLERIVEKYADVVDAAILGCTELPLAIKNATVPLLDTAKIHVEKLMEEASA